MKVGDRVRCIKIFEGNEYVVGQEGTVARADSYIRTTVRFDKSNSKSHTCYDGNGCGYCWDFPAIDEGVEKYLEVISEKKETKNMEVIKTVETKHYVNGMDVEKVTVDEQIELIHLTEERINFLNELGTRTKAIDAEVEKLQTNLTAAVKLFNK